MFRTTKMHRIIDMRDIFIESYRAYPIEKKGQRDDIEYSNNIILPPSALQKLSLNFEHNITKNPFLFSILNIDFNIFTHCGVAEFTAEEGICYIPSNLFDRLHLEEGQKVNIRKKELRPGTYIKVQPHKTEFTNNPNAKTILEYNLRNYFCLTKGDTISLKFKNENYKIDIIECKPENQIRILNCNLEIDFEEAKDFKEYQKKNNIKKEDITSSNIIHLEKITDNSINLSGSKIIFNSEPIPIKLTEEEKKNQILEKKFSGHNITIDGKEERKIINVKEEEQNKEDNYDSRKCRISSGERPEFKNVELKFGE